MLPDISLFHNYGNFGESDESERPCAIYPIEPKNEVIKLSHSL